LQIAALFTGHLIIPLSQEAYYQNHRTTMAMISRNCQ
jgi:hypothetical protein